MAFSFIFTLKTAQCICICEPIIKSGGKNEKPSLGPNGCLQNFSHCSNDGTRCSYRKTFVTIYWDDYLSIYRWMWPTTRMTGFQVVWNNLLRWSFKLFKLQTSMTTLLWSGCDHLQGQCICTLSPSRYSMHHWLDAYLSYSRNSWGMWRYWNGVIHPHNSNALISAMVGMNEQARLSPILPYSNKPCMQRFCIGMVYSWQQGASRIKKEKRRT